MKRRQVVTKIPNRIKDNELFFRPVRSNYRSQHHSPGPQAPSPPKRGPGPVMVDHNVSMINSRDHSNKRQEPYSKRGRKIVSAQQPRQKKEEPGGFEMLSNLASEIRGKFESVPKSDRRSMKLSRSLLFEHRSRSRQRREASSKNSNQNISIAAKSVRTRRSRTGEGYRTRPSEPKNSRPESLPRVQRREHKAQENVNVASKLYTDFHTQANFLLGKLEMSVLGSK